MAAGRKRGFDKEAALNKATHLFWTNGYSGTSLSDITETLAIAKPSLYAAFGNKEDLFIASIHHYLDKYGGTPLAHLFTPDLNLKERLRHTLQGIVDLMTDPELPGGCFMTMNLIDAKSECLPERAATEVNAAYDNMRDQLKDFFAMEISQKHLSTSSEPEALAESLLTMQFGLAVMGRHSRDPKSMDKVIEHFLNSFDYSDH